MRPNQSETDLLSCAIVLMGVSGCGKSTLGSHLAEVLDRPFLDGDDFHSDASIAKMRSGQPLCDDDRWPWLDRLGSAIQSTVASEGIAIAACSALKRRYRERLVTAAKSPILFVLLEADRSELARRLAQRPGHFMPATLLDSQLAALERPDRDERALIVDAHYPVERLGAFTLAWARSVLAGSVPVRG